MLADAEDGRCCSRCNVVRSVSLFLFAFAVLLPVVLKAVSARAATGDTWVLSETRVNPGNEQTEFVAGPSGTPQYFNEPRFEGKFQRYTIAATSITSHNRDVDHGIEHWNMTSQTSFDTPPSVLVPGEVVTLSASGSASGSALDEWTAGEQFEFRADGVTLEGETYFSITINSATAPSSGSVSPKFTVPVPWSDDAEIVIKAFYWNCASCLVEWVYRADVAPPTTTSPSITQAPTTPRAPATTQQEPLECFIRGRVADAGARPSGHRDEGGHPLIGVMMTLVLNGSELGISTVTDQAGEYSILVEDGDLPPGTDIDSDEVQVQLELLEAAHDPPRFVVIHKRDLAKMRSDRFVLGDECAGDGFVERDFPLGAIPDDYEAIAPAKDRWADISEIYHRIHKGTQLADLLNQKLDYDTLIVCAFCTNFLTEKADTAFWCGERSNGTNCSHMWHIGFGDETSLLSNKEWPDNREYHEFGHQFLADSFGNKAPGFAGNTNHAGYYENPSSTDSWTEGWAEFFSTMVAKHIDGESMPELYLDWYNMEFDYRPWLAEGQAEELAIAGVLLDLEDGPEDYAGGRVLPNLVVDWFDTYADPALGSMLVGEVVNRSDHVWDYSEQTMVAAEFRQGGSVVHTGWAITMPWDLPGAGGRGFFAIVVPQDIEWDRVELAAFEGRPGDVGTDDDPVNLTLNEVWKTIVVYTSVHPESNGYLFDAADLYDAFSAEFGGRDADGNGVDDIDQIFIAHGLFADRDGDRSFHSETPGMTDHPARGEFAEFIPRRDTPPLPGTLMTVDTGPVDARVVVQVLLPNAGSYSYVTTPDDTGRVHVAVPPQSQGGSVMLGVVADGYEPAVAGVIDVETFWADVDLRGEDAAPTFTVALVPEETERSTSLGVVLIVVGVGLIVLVLATTVGIRGVLRRREQRT